MGNDSNVFGTEDRNIIEMVQDVLGRYMPVLYVSCAEGPTSTTIYALERLKEQGVADVSVFLDCSMVDDVELCDLVEIEIRECANEHGFNGDSITVQRGYAR
ncbi:MAG: hypothetical protein LBQ80_04560 [Clostridium sp.]|jgi:translation elongation factor EF-Tu-like GTPase|nr:hypothetical protein [Clostridium sp.]